MSREIKFRVWDGSKMSSNIRLCNISSWVMYNNKSVAMQYTGLKDKNEKEIYEGDIFEFVEEEQGNIIVRYQGIVTFEDGGYWFQEDKPLAGFDISGEVIGNIYENPENMGQ